MSLSRRTFLKGVAGVSAGFLGLRSAFAEGGPAGRPADRFGPLVDDPRGVLALPEGFRYRIVSRVGETMDDGFLVPAAHDGMAAFPAPGGRTLLVRNHEVSWGRSNADGAFGARLELLERLDPGLLYDGGDGTRGPALGGTTTLLYDTGTQRLLGHRLSLAGTLRNCAGGPTPWGSWLTCEETVLRTGGGRARDHGWVFEVPADWDAPLRPPVALRSLGRFNHEAVAVDPRTGIVYLTEDDGEGLLYRFLPDTPGELARGGHLQALAVVGEPRADTRNWNPGGAVPVGSKMEVAWIGLAHPESPDGDLRLRGHAAGAARFARGEGAWWGGDALYFVCTNGGRARKGQVWRYVPGPREGTPLEREEPGTLELFLEPDDGTLVENADNLTVAPWGDLVLCEDGTGDDYLVGVTPEGEVYKLGHNLTGTGELAGATFSPDGSTLFVNVQTEGLTLAVTGPWIEP